jgi:hypothetical protein
LIIVSLGGVSLTELGYNDNFYQPHLGKLILLLMDLDDVSDEIFQFHYAVVEKRSRKVGSVMKQAMKVYGELEGEEECK